MAIRLGLTELKRIAGRTADIDAELNKDLVDVINELNNICQNVRSSELTSANQNLVNAINNIIDKIKQYLPVITLFFNNQIEKYDATNEATRLAINTLVDSINNSFGSSAN